MNRVLDVRKFDLMLEEVDCKNVDIMIEEGALPINQASAFYTVYHNSNNKEKQDFFAAFAPKFIDELLEIDKHQCNDRNCLLKKFGELRETYRRCRMQFSLDMQWEIDALIEETIDVDYIYKKVLQYFELRRACQ